MSRLNTYQIKEIFRGRRGPPLHVVNTTAVAVATAFELWQQIQKLKKALPFVCLSVCGSEHLEKVIVFIRFSRLWRPTAKKTFALYVFNVCGGRNLEKARLPQQIQKIFSVTAHTCTLSYFKRSPFET